MEKCLIIGSGPAGYTAAIYASRAGLNPIVIAGNDPGGQLTTTNEIENYPGFESINGFDLMDLMKNQAEKLGTRIVGGCVTSVDFSQKPFKVIVDENNIYESQTVIIATGATAKYTGLPSEQTYKGVGVSACAVCDGFFFKKKDVVVVGGGDTAAGDALYLSKICNKVYLVVRKPYMRASRILQERIVQTPNIELLTEHVVSEIYGNGKVEGVKLKYRVGQPNEVTKDISVSGYFAAVGRSPQTEIFAPYISTDASGYIITQGNSAKTNVEGVFACGDCADPVYRQAVVAAGTGCRAALDAESYLSQL